MSEIKILNITNVKINEIIDVVTHCEVIRCNSYLSKKETLVHW